MLLPTAPVSRQVFISHSSRDAAAAASVCQALETAGIGCWIAPRDIHPGQDWSEAIVAGLVECRLTLLVFTENANASVQVRREIQFSFENGKSVVPWRIEDIFPTGAFAYYLNPVHWLNALTAPLESHLPLLVAYVQQMLAVTESGTVLSQASEAKAPPSTVAATPPPGNLPEPLAPLIGREALLPVWLEKVTNPVSRLVTLCAFGGMGKSRSALELARQCGAEVAPGGIWWVELDDAQSEGDLLQRIAAAVGLTLDPQSSVLEQVAGRLRQGGRTLLILDNTEQIEAASRAVSQLLKAAPELDCLVTSRRALEIAGEQVVEVPPLTPEEGEALFIERAQARQATFTRTADNADDITELIRRLDGVPLAIELAAPRISTMTPRDIVARLSERFRLLQSRASHLPERQRTLNGAIEWSYDLLREDDQDLLRQISVFANGFTLEAAETVCPDVFDVFEGIHELRRHSLLHAETNPKTQQTRFSQLEFLREWGAQKLTAQGEEWEAAAKDRHARYYLGFAEAHSNDLTKEIPNLRAAFAHTSAAVTAGNNEAGIPVRLALAMFQPLYDIGYWDELGRIVEAALAIAESASGSSIPSPLKAALHLRQGSLLYDRGGFPRSRAEAETALGLSGEDNTMAITAHNLLGLIAADEEKYDEAEAHFQSSLTRCGAADDLGRTHAIYNLARLTSAKGDQERARTLYEESLTYWRERGDRRGEAKTLTSLGAVAFLAGDFSEARRLYEQGISALRSLDDRQGVAALLYNLAELAEKENELPRTVGLFFHAQQIFQTLRSALAALPEAELSRLRVTMGENAFDAIRNEAQGRAWETYVDPTPAQPPS